MVTHWESSRRPLYVKTVWKDGQHHVMLRKEEEPIRRAVTASPTARTVSSASKATSRKASSVKLLLAGVANFNVAEPQLRRCRTGVQQPPSWDIPVTGRGISKESKTKRSKNLNLSVKSHSLEIHLGRDNSEKLKSISSRFNCNIACHDSLSERVMIWLDLATQNGNYEKEATLQSQHVATPCRVRQKRDRTAVKRRSFADYQSKSDIHVEGVSHELHFMTPSILRDGSLEEKEGGVVACDSSSEEDEELPQLTSAEESFITEELQEDSPKSRMSTVKRQLHIFMPELSKRFSDCDSSIMSSKRSSSSLQKYVISKF